MKLKIQWITLTFLFSLQIVFAQIILGSPSYPTFDVFTNGRLFLTDLPENGGEELITRINNYIFDGEVIYSKVIAINLNGTDNIQSVFTTVGHNQGGGQEDFWSYCNLGKQPEEGSDVSDYNIRLGDYGSFDYFNSSIMKYYDCYLIAGDIETLHGGYWTSIFSNNSDGEIVNIDENEYWFFNPTFDIDYVGELNVENNLTSGEIIYSDWINLTSSYEEGSGFMHYFIEVSGTDFYNSQGELVCGSDNFFSLNNINYFAETSLDFGYYFNTSEYHEYADSEGYVPISYENYPIMGNSTDLLEYYLSNMLYHSESTMSLKFRITVPENCVGEIDQGVIKIFAHALQNVNANSTLEITFNPPVPDSVDITLLENVTYLDENGNPFNPPTSIDEGFIVRYLAEGEQIVFDVEVYSPNGIERVERVSLTAGDIASGGNDILTECNLYNYIDDAHAIFHCSYTIENINYWYGLYNVGVEAQLISGLIDYEWLGLHYFNPIATCYSNLDCDDGNSISIDHCIYPSTPQSYCVNKILATSPDNHTVIIYRNTPMLYVD